MSISKNEAAIKVRVKRKPRVAFRKISILIISFWVIFLAYGFIRDLVITHLAKVEQVEQGVIQSSLPAQGILVRNEKTVPAPRTGKLKVLVSEGERVRVGETVAQVIVKTLDSITGETTFDITTPCAGIISYHLDGLEEVYTPENVGELDLGKIEQLRSRQRQFLAGNQVEEGEPVFKIVNNLAPVYIIALTADGLKFPEKGKKKSFSIYFDLNEKVVTQAVILESGFRGKDNQLLLSLANYNEMLMLPRKLDFQIITDRFEGYVVPAGAIVRKEGKDGIFTVFKEQVRWKKIEICGQAEGKVVISGITPNLRVILNPKYVKEGYPIK